MFDTGSIQVWSGDVLTVLLDWAVKGCALLAVAAVAALAMRKASAARRQLLWLVALAGLLLLPVASAVLPEWNVLPEWANIRVPAEAVEVEPAPADLPAITVSKSAGGPTAIAIDGSGGGAGVDPVAPMLPPLMDRTPLVDTPADETEPAPAALAAPDSPGHRWLVTGLAGLWLLGVAVCLAPLLLGRLSLWRLARRSRVVDDSAWLDLLARTAAAVGLRRRVVLLQSPDHTMPMVWGTRRPRLLLPAESEDWPSDRRRVVLLHELAHAKRRDCLSKFIAHVACAVYWFNPLAWIAFRLMQREAEQACDDLVLSAGSRPSDYAQHLLEIASGLKSGMLAAYSSIAMARKSKLEGRLLAILDPRRDRKALTRIALVLAAGLVTAVAAPLAVLGVEAETSAETPDIEIAGQPATADAHAREVWESITLRGIVPNGGDDFLTPDGTLIAKTLGVGPWDVWGDEKQAAAIVFDVENADEVCWDVFPRLHNSETGRGLGASSFGMRAWPEGKNQFAMTMVIDRTETQSGLLFDKQIPIERVDITLKYYLRKPGESYAVFRGPFGPKDTRKAKGLTLTLEPIPRSDGCRFRLEGQNLPVDAGSLERIWIIDHNGRRRSVHIGGSRSESGGTVSCWCNGDAENLSPDEIAAIIVGEKPHTKTFRNVPVRHPREPVRSYPAYLDKLAAALGTPDIDREKLTANGGFEFKSHAEIMDAADVLRGPHIAAAQQFFFSPEKIENVTNEQRQKLRVAVQNWVDHGLPEGLILGLQMKWPEFVDPAIEKLRESFQERWKVAYFLGHFAGLSPEQLDRIATLLLEDDDPRGMPSLLRGFRDRLNRKAPGAHEAMLRLANSEKVWLWWDVIRWLTKTRGRRADLPAELTVKYVAVAGDEYKGDPALRLKAGRLLAAALDAKLVAMSTSVGSEAVRHVVELLPRDEAQDALLDAVEKIRDGRSDYTYDGYSPDYDCLLAKIAQYLNRWHGLNFGGIGTDEKALDTLYRKQNWNQVADEILIHFGRKTTPATQPAVGAAGVPFQFEVVDRAKHQWRLKGTPPVDWYVLHGCCWADDVWIREHAGGGSRTTHTAQWDFAWRHEGDTLVLSRTPGGALKPVWPEGAELKITAESGLVTLYPDRYTELWRGDLVKDGRVLKSVRYLARLADDAGMDAGFLTQQDPIATPETRAGLRVNARPAASATQPAASDAPSPKAPATRLVEGRAVDANGRPVADAEVLVLRFGLRARSGGYPVEQSIVGRGRSGADGRFRIEVRGVPAEVNLLEVVARKRGVGFGFNQTMGYRPKDGKVREVRLHGTGRLEGVVVDESGRPIENADVRADLFGEGNSCYDPDVLGCRELDWFGARTGKDGRFAIAGIPTDFTAELIVRAAGYGAVATQKYSRYPGASQVTWFRGDQKDIRIVLPRERRIQGVAVDKSTGKPVEGVRVLAYETLPEDQSTVPLVDTSPRVSLTPPAFATSAKDGSFAIDGLKPGRWVVGLVRPTDAVGPPEWLLRPVAVDLREGDGKPITLSLERGTLVEVQLVDALGRGVRGRVLVQEVSKSGLLGLSMQVSGQDGVASLRLLPGHHRLHAIDYPDPVVYPGQEAPRRLQGELELLVGASGVARVLIGSDWALPAKRGDGPRIKVLMTAPADAGAHAETQPAKEAPDLMRPWVAVSFAPVVERRLKIGDGVDLATGKVVRLPADPDAMNAAKRTAWARESGADVCVVRRDGVLALWFIDTKASFTLGKPAATRWQTADPGSLRERIVDSWWAGARQVVSSDAAERKGRLTDLRKSDWGPIDLKELPFTAQVLTAQREMGLFEVVQSAGDPPVVTVRWKLLKANPAASQPAEDWGETNKSGVQARLRADKRTWAPGQIPTFRADIRNRGTGSYSVVQAQQFCTIEVDGTPYDWVGDIAVKFSALPPGRVYGDIPITLTDHWVKTTPGRGERTGTEKLRLTPGRHRLRVIFHVDVRATVVDRDGGSPSLNFAVRSNAVEFEIPAPGVRVSGLTFGALATLGKARPVWIETRLREPGDTVYASGFVAMNNGPVNNGTLIFTGYVRELHDDSVTLVASPDLLNTPPAEIPAGKKVTIARTAIVRIDEVLPTSQPATQPATDASPKSAGMTPHVYDVRDLIVPMLGHEAPALPWSDPVSEISEKEREKVDATREQEQKTELMARLIKTIKEVCGPNTWYPKAGGSINELSGNLVITQTPEAHAQIRQVIATMRKARSLQIATEARFVEMPGSEVQRLEAWLKKESPLLSRRAAVRRAPAFPPCCPTSRSKRLFGKPARSRRHVC